MKGLLKGFIVVVIVCYTMTATGACADKEAKGTCSLNGYVIWEFNKSVGKKPDIGATVYLFRRFQPRIVLKAKDVHAKETNIENGLYIKEVGIDGKYEIKDIPTGLYDLLIVSEATNRNFFVKYDPKIDHMQEYTRFSKLTEDSLITLRTVRSRIPVAGASAPELRQFREELERAQGDYEWNHYAAWAHLDFARLHRNILEPHFELSDYEYVVTLLVEKKYKVIEKLELKSGVGFDKNVDFGNTFIAIGK